MIKVLFFVQVCELVGIDLLIFDVSELVIVEVVCQQFVVCGDCWVLVLEEGKLLVVVNQMLIFFEYLVVSGDEVVFFLLVMGG